MSSIPYDAVEGLFRLGLTSVLLAVVIFLSYLKRIGVEREIVIATVRGFAQLMLLALVFAFIFESPDWAILVVGLFTAMVLFAGDTSSKRAKPMPKAFRITTPSILAGAGITLSVMALTQIMPLRPQFVIPLAGMAFGNSMRICSVTLDRLKGELESNRELIGAALALGANSEEALEPYSRAAVRAGLIGNIDSMKTLGIIFIPGAMAGLLLAGTPPLVAAEYQIVVFFMIFSAGMITALMVSRLARSRIFTEAHQLREWI